MDGWTGVKAIREKTYMVISCTFEDRRFRVIRFTALSSIIPFFLFFFFFVDKVKKFVRTSPGRGRHAKKHGRGPERECRKAI